MRSRSVSISRLHTFLRRICIDGPNVYRMVLVVNLLCSVSFNQNEEGLTVDPTADFNASIFESISQGIETSI